MVVVELKRTRAGRRSLLLEAMDCDAEEAERSAERREARVSEAILICGMCVRGVVL